MSFETLLGPLIGAGASLISGASASDAAGNAAQQQTQASDAQIAEARRQYDLSRADQAPFMEAGLSGNARLRYLLGLGPNDSTVAGNSALTSGGGFGSLIRPFSAESLNADPVYQSGLKFGLDTGTAGINARAIGTGNYDSGATLKALIRYGNDYGSTKANESYNRYNADQSNIYNRLAGFTGAGQAATNQVQAAGTNESNQVQSSIADAGNARAAGIVGGANAWGSAAGGMNSAINNYQSNQTLQKLLAGRGGYGSSGYGGDSMYNYSANLSSPFNNSDNYG